MRNFPPSAAISAGLLAAFVGFASSFPVVLQGLRGVGATPAQAASGLMALSIAMGLCGVALSLRYRMPISVAWSTPGAALLASAGAPDGGFATAAGAFVIAAALVIAAGVVRPLGRAIEAIPASIANAMLAGILFNLTLAPVKAIGVEPAAGLAIVGVWVVVSRLRRLLAVPAAALTAIAAIVWRSHGLDLGPLLPQPLLVVPQFGLQSAIGIALPLFLVTMASQNIPGLAVLRINGYAPPPAGLFTATGAFSLLAIPFGGHAVNLAAITAAICAGEEAGPDPAARWWAGVVSGLAYVAFGLGAGAITAFAGLSPILIEAVAGLALIGALATSLQAATALPEERVAAVAAFLTTASGVAFFGISAPFWGLAAGAAMLAVFGRAKPGVSAAPPQEAAVPRPIPGSL